MNDFLCFTQEEIEGARDSLVEEFRISMEVSRRLRKILQDLEKEMEEKKEEIQKINALLSRRLSQENYLKRRYE